MKLTVKEMTVFAMLGALMYASKVLMDFLPNIHLIGTFVMAITLVYGKKALWPIYVFVFITGLFGGFATWWLPHLYLWLPLWAVTMILPKNLSSKWQPILYMVVCAIHGLLYGILYAPAQALLFGYNFQQTLAWIAAGLPFDLIHGISNFFCALLIVPLTRIFRLAKSNPL